MRHRAARGRARRFPRRGVPRTECGEQGHASGRCARAFRVQSAGHAVQRAARGVGVRGWDASRALGAPGDGRLLAASPEAGAATTKDAAACIAAELERRVAQDVPPVLPPLPPPAPKSAKGDRRARRRGRKRAARAATADAVARDAAHAPRAQRRAIAVQRVRPMVRAAGHHAAGGGWSGEPRRARAAGGSRPAGRGDRGGNRGGARRRTPGDETRARRSGPRTTDPDPACGRYPNGGPALGRRPVLRGGPRLALAVGGR